MEANNSLLWLITRILDDTPACHAIKRKFSRISAFYVFKSGIHYKYVEKYHVECIVSHVCYGPKRVFVEFVDKMCSSNEKFCDFPPTVQNIHYFVVFYCFVVQIPSWKQSKTTSKFCLSPGGSSWSNHFCVLKHLLNFGLPDHICVGSFYRGSTVSPRREGVEQKT